jgi:uncharacterized protein YyaL (SSP411 family)
MHTNRLAAEKSPYLLQHAHNPVDWYSWGSDAFEKSRQENKPIFLSIGYSTCHWCHVMERESFESEEIAAVLNRFFVPVKVDREERPDVDRIYMTFVQATTGGGGWPMSVWLTPELKPFYGGTYFPPDSRWGRPGFRQILEQLAMAWQTDREQIVESGNDVIEKLKAMGESGGVGRIDSGIPESGYFQFRRAFDSRNGGFGGAPKFPRPCALNFLLRYGYANRNDEASEMVSVTLRQMAKGGMNDQLGGGFHRYSVDANWFVPHFEKMLYDQAQLAISYLETYQVTGDLEFANTARSIFDYVLRDMTHPGGGFFSAEDADSVIDPAHPHEKGEGAFYIWEYSELEKALGTATAEWFSYRYGVEPNGNVAEDPHSEFTGRNILWERFSIAETASHFGIEETAMRSALDAAASTLMKIRNTRVRPHHDDKILTAWNGLMISAFAKGARILAEPRYLEAARRATAFLLTNLDVDNVLLRRWRDGEGGIGGFLDDYAFFVQGLLDLYEADFEDAHVQAAIDLTARMRQLFEDREDGGFFSTTDADSSLVLRVKEDYDGAEPSGNSIAILNLLRLGRITGDDQYGATAEKALGAFGRKLAAGPTALPQMLVSAMYSLAVPRQIVLAGARESLEPMLDVLRHRFLPFHTLLWSGSSELNEELRRMTSGDGQPTAWVCENFTCQLPTSDRNKFAELLQ